MHKFKIPGAKYYLSLEEDQNQYWLRIRLAELSDAIEDEVPITHLDNKAIRNNIKELLVSVNLNLNDLQIDLIHKNVTDKITELLDKEPEDIPFNPAIISDSQVDEIINRLDTIEKRIRKLEIEISEKENSI